MSNLISHQFDLLKRTTKRCLALGELMFATLVFKMFFKLNRRCILTCNRSDGGGAQIHGRFTVLAFANFFGVKYLNTPISKAHFGDGRNWNTSDPEWDFKWNSLIKFDDLTENDKVNTKLINTVTTTDLWKFILKTKMVNHSGVNYLFELESAHPYTNLRPNILLKNREQFRNMLSPTVLKSNESIVVHLRRGNDVTANIRFEKNKKLFTWLSKLSEKYPQESIRVYTNEEFQLPDQYKDFVVLDNQSSPFEAITHMASCKVLVIAKSSMSYVAALMNTQTVYCPNFWHPKLKNWHSLTELEVIN